MSTQSTHDWRYTESDVRLPGHPADDTCGSSPDCAGAFGVERIESEPQKRARVLLQEIAQGHASAFWELWQCHYDMLYQRCLVWMGGDLVDTEDALSTAMLKACQKVSKYAVEIINIEGWLIQLTHNVCLDVLRERKKSAGRIGPIEKMVWENEKAVLPDWEHPESIFLRHELKAYIYRTIDNLPLRLKEPAMLRFYQEMPYKDIAEQLKLSSPNVRKRIQQTRAILQAQLTRYLSGDPERFQSIQARPDRTKSVAK